MTPRLEIPRSPRSAAVGHAAAPLLLDRIAAAALLGVSPSTLDRLAAAGKIRRRQLRRRVLYLRDDLVALAQSL